MIIVNRIISSAHKLPFCQVFQRDMVDSSRFKCASLQRNQCGVFVKCVRFKASVSTKPPGRSRHSRHDSGRSYYLLVIPFTTFCLGTWQIRRRQWKLDLIERLEQLTLAEPVPFPENLDSVRELEYRRVVVRGTFDHSQELYVVPRSPVTSDSQGGGLISAGNSQTGAYVITALQLADRDLRILVNRGWVPRNQINPATRPEGQVMGEVEFVGVVRKPETRPAFGAKNDASRNHWHYRDQDKMAEALNTSAIFVDADKDSTVKGGPIGGQTRLSLRNEHLSYIITWYSLSAITFLGWYTRYWKR